jgi:hypothetical protein
MSAAGHSRKVGPAALSRVLVHELERLLYGARMTPCEHCPAPGANYTLRYLSAGERRPREHQRSLCLWHADQYQLLAERWSGVLISIEPAF